MIVVLTLGACQAQTLNGGPIFGQAGPPAAPAPVLQPAPVPPPAPVAGVQRSEPPVAAPTLELDRVPIGEPSPSLTRPTDAVALMLPLSGQSARIGRAMLDAAQMAVFDIAGEDFTLNVYDTQGTSQGAEDAARLAVADGARLVLGPLFGRSAAAVRPILAEAGVNAVAFSNDHAVAGPPVYLMGLMPEGQVERMVRFAAAKGYRRLGLMLPRGDYGNRVLESARQATLATGAEISRVVYYDSQAADFDSVTRGFADYDSRREALRLQRAALAGRGDDISKQTLARLEGLDTLGDPPYDAVLIPEGGSVLRNIAPLLAYYDVDPKRVKLIGTAQWEDPGLGAEPSLVGSWFAAPPPEYRQSFAQRYAQAFGSPPPGLASLAYDSIALAVSLQRGESGPDYGAAALTGANGFVALNGLFRFGANGTNQRGLAVFEVRARSLAVIDPAPDRFSDVTN